MITKHYYPLLEVRVTCKIIPDILFLACAHTYCTHSSHGTRYRPVSFLFMFGQAEAALSCIDPSLSEHETHNRSYTFYLSPDYKRAKKVNERQRVKEDQRKALCRILSLHAQRVYACSRGLHLGADTMQAYEPSAFGANIFSFKRKEHTAHTVAHRSAA